MKAVITQQIVNHLTPWIGLDRTFPFSYLVFPGKTIDELATPKVARIHTYRKQLPAEIEKPASVFLTSATWLRYVDFSKFPWPGRYKQDVNALLDKIRQNHDPEQITMLNYHTGSFLGISPFRQSETDETKDAKVTLYLVVLMKNAGLFQFRCTQVGLVRAMVVYMNVKEVETKLANGNRFVHAWWTKGTILCRRSTFRPTFQVAAVSWKTQQAEEESVWFHARATMTSLNEVIQHTPQLTLSMGSLLLRSLLEIGVSSYLRCAAGYIPYRSSLAELIDWSGIVGRSVVNFLYPANQKDEACLYFVLNPRSVWRQDVTTSLSTTSQMLYRDKANEWMKFFEVLCADVLEELSGKAAT